MGAQTGMLRRLLEAANSNLNLAAAAEREEPDRKTVGFLARTSNLCRHPTLHRTQSFQAIHSGAAAAARLLFSLVLQDNRVKLAPHQPSRLFSKGACRPVDCKKQKRRRPGQHRASQRDDEAALLHPGNVNSEGQTSRAFYTNCFFLSMFPDWTHRLH